MATNNVQNSTRDILVDEHLRTLGTNIADASDDLMDEANESADSILGPGNNGTGATDDDSNNEFEEINPGYNQFTRNGP